MTDRQIDNVNNKIYACGTFTSFSGSTQNRLIRLNLDGSKDSSFNIGSGFTITNQVVNSMLLYNNYLYCVGGFTIFNGVSKNRLIRLNLDGTIDNTFNIDTGFGNSVYIIKIYNDKIYCVGKFTSYSGLTHNHLIRLNLDGTIDSTFNTDTGFDNSVYDILIKDDLIYVGGGYTSYSNIDVYNIVRLNLDGTINPFNNVIETLSDSLFGYYRDIQIINNKIYLFGKLPTYQIFNMDGSLYENYYYIFINNIKRYEYINLKPINIKFDKDTYYSIPYINAYDDSNNLISAKGKSIILQNTDIINDLVGTIKITANGKRIN